MVVVRKSAARKIRASMSRENQMCIFRKGGTPSKKVGHAPLIRGFEGDGMKGLDDPSARSWGAGNQTDKKIQKESGRWGER